MRISWKALLVLAVLGLGFAGQVSAGVPKVVFVDEFGYVT